MARRFIGLVALLASANVALVPAMAADIRPAAASVSTASFTRTLTGGRVGAPVGRQENLGAAGAAIFLAIPAVALAVFAAYRASKSDNPSSR